GSSGVGEMPGRLICPSLGTAEIIQINNKNSIFAYSSVEKASKMKKPYSQPPACLLYCTKFTGTKNPLSGGFKLCGEVTTLNTLIAFLL
ncbi:TPA: hypothetical protein ACXIZB_003810, partial [Escherichia coli]